MVQFLSIHFFSWISSIFVGFFKSSRFFCVILYNMKQISFSTLQNKAQYHNSLHLNMYVSS